MEERQYISDTCTMKVPNPGAESCWDCVSEHMISNCPRFGGRALGEIYLEKERKREALAEVSEERDHILFTT